MAIIQLELVHDSAFENTFQVTKLVKLNIKQSLVKPLSIISEQTAILHMRIHTCG